MFWLCEYIDFISPQIINRNIQNFLFVLIFVFFISMWCHLIINRDLHSALIGINLHSQSNPLMTLKIFATVHSLMNYTNLIDSCQAHLSVKYTSKIKLIRHKYHWCCDWQWATPESHVQNKPLVCSIGCLCSSWLFLFSVLHSDKTVNKIIF